MARPKNTQNIGRYKHDPELNAASAARIQAVNQAYNNEIKGYKELAAERRKSRRYNIQEVTRALNGMVNYVVECANSQRPATVAGMILASGTNKDFYYKAKQGDYDYITTEYIVTNNIDPSMCQTDENGLLIYPDEQLNDRLILSMGSDVIEKCLLLMENDLQIRSLTDKSMARTTGAIFNLKAVFNYNDKPEAEVKTVNNTLIVNASPEQTSKAMQLLLKDK